MRLKRIFLKMESDDKCTAYGIKKRVRAKYD